MSERQRSPDYVSYLLRLWCENDAGESTRENDTPVWRASVVSTLTGRRQGFANLEALFNFLREPGAEEPRHYHRETKAEHQPERR